jgi:hypothetical protein
MSDHRMSDQLKGERRKNITPLSTQLKQELSEITISLRWIMELAFMYVITSNITSNITLIVVIIIIITTIITAINIELFSYTYAYFYRRTI